MRDTGVALYEWSLLLRCYTQGSGQSIDAGERNSTPGFTFGFKRRRL